VTEEKILLYLETVVMPRGNTKLPKKRSKEQGSQEGEDNETSGYQPLSYEGLDNYVKALIHLHKTQNSLRGNKLDPVRGDVLKNQLKSYRLRQRDRDVGACKDRHEGTLFDGYTEEQFVEVILILKYLEK
jgi:hypothetical protein